MRIGIEAQRIFRSKKHGMDIVALNTIKALQQLDKINEYFIFTNEQDDTDCLQETANFKIVRAGGYSYPIWEQFILPRLAKQYNLDLLHCTSNTAPLNIETKLVITLHDIIYLENNPLRLKGTLYQKWGNFYRSQIVPLVLPKADKVVTVSNFEKQRISEFLQIPDEKLDAVYNGVSDHFFKEATRVQINIAQIRYKLPKAYIFLLGNTDPKKNIARTLKAYELYRDKAEHPLPLVIADLSEEILVQLVHENGIDVEILPYIHLTGYIPNPDLPVLYKLSSLFLYVSNRESFGIPILEAMASGIPVITSTTSSMPEVAGNAAALANPFDFKDIASKMVAVLEDQLWRTILIRRGLAHVEKFRWTETAEQILQMYTSIVQPQTQIVSTEIFDQLDFGLE